MDNVEKLQEKVNLLTLMYDQQYDEIKRLEKYRDLVWFIANDFNELSHEKVMLQRDDWKKRCNKLRDELEFDNGGFTPEELNHRVDEDF